MTRAARWRRPLYEVPLAALAVLALALGCARPSVVRNGVEMAYEQAAAVDLAEARERLEAGDHAGARRALDRFAADVPQSRRADEALFLLGEVQLGSGDPEGAAAAWRRLVQRHRRSRLNPEAGYRAALLYRDLGRVEEGRRVLAAAQWQRADDELRPRMHRLRADLARASGDYADAVRALAYSRRDTTSADALLEIDLELDELIDDRLREREIEELVTSLPRGPVYDRVNLALARRALGRLDYEAARRALARLPRRLRPVDEAERQRLLERADRGAALVVRTLGLAVPLSGQYAPLGEAVLRAVVLALGVFDEQDAHFLLAIRDTRGEVERGSAAVGELIEEGVSAIIGPMSSRVSAAAAPLAEAAGVPLLSLARREDVSLLGDFVFRLGLTPTDQARALAGWAIEERGFGSFAVLYPDDSYGTTFKNIFWDEVESRGGRMVGVERYSPGTTDVQDEIKRLVGLYYLTDVERERLSLRERLLRRPQENAEQLADPNLVALPPYVDFDALFIPDSAAEVGLILPQLRFYDIRDVTYLGASEWNDNELIERAGSEASGAVFAGSFYARDSDPVVQSFVRRFTDAYGARPDGYAAEAYDAALLLRTLIEERDAISREELRRRILEVREFPGVSGVTSFDASGGTRKSPLLLTVRNRSIRPLEELP